MSKVLIGYVKRWQYLQPDLEKKLAGEPKEGSVYRIVYDDEVSSDRTYQIYVGKDSNPAKMDTIFLGNGDHQDGDKGIDGNYHDKWTFEIAFLNKDNYLEFDFKPEELPVLQQWLDSDNADLKGLLRKTPEAVDVQNLPEHTITSALKKVMEAENEYDASMQRMSDALNTIVAKDTKLSTAISDLLTYIASTYKDKYEAVGTINTAREFLMQSNSPDVAGFNAIKYIQRYCTSGFEKSGKVVDIHKAAHYLLFELQRAKQQKDNAQN